MMNRTVLFAFILLATLAPEAFSEMTLASQGETNYTIVTKAEAAETVTLAAQELKRYLKTATGADFPLATGLSAVGGPTIAVLLLDDAPAKLHIPDTALGAEGFAIKTLGDDLYLVGARPRSTLYAVYWFLKDYLGARFYCFDDERIPKVEELQIGNIDRIERPAFAYRGLKGWSPVGIQMHWMAKMGMNYVQNDLRLAKSGTIDPERYRDFADMKNKWDLMWDLGGHYTTSLLPPEKHFEDHPDWYSLILSPEEIEQLGDDYYQRRYDESAGERNPVQMCSSSEEAVETFVGNFIHMAEQYPEADVYAAWYSDGTTYCQCHDCIRQKNWLWINEHPACQHWVKPHQVIGTKQVLEAMNPVAEAMARVAPEKKLFTIAYVNTVPAPTEIMSHPNLNIQFATYHRCYSRPIDVRGDDNCDEVNEYFDQNLRKWVSVCRGDVIIYYYACAKSSMDGRMMPFPHIIAGDVKHFHRIGVRGVLSQHGWPWAFNLNAYTLAKMLWDPALTADEIIQEYCQRYGQAAPDMTEYFNEMETAMKVLHHPEWLGDNWTGPPPERMQKMNRAMHHISRAQDALNRALEKETATPGSEALARDRDLFTWTKRSYEIWTEYARARLLLHEDRLQEAETSYQSVVSLIDSLEKDRKDLNIHQNLYRSYRYCQDNLTERGLGGTDSAQ